MTSKTLDEIRKKLQAMGGRKDSTTQGNRDKTTYPHWNIPEGTSSVQRFLPDANEENTFFWAERQIFKLPFPGVKGLDENKPVIVQAPCIEMWEPKYSCPILNEVRPWWKDESLKKTASTYWIKRTYYMQGFVTQDPMSETDVPENPIRKFIMGPQIFAIIRAALLDPEMGPHSPVDYINGRNFIISKTSKGGYADYGTSKWSMKETSITEDMQEAIDKYGLVDLSTYLPKKPDAEHLSAMFEMFKASLDGELYDPARWSQYYKPFGFDSAVADDSDGGESKRTVRSVVPRQTAVIPQQVTEDEEIVVTASKTEVAEQVSQASPTQTSGKTPQEILAMLKNRNK